MSSLITARTADRRRSRLLGRGRYDESNRGDDHGVPAREDYTVEFSPFAGAVPPAAVPSPYASTPWVSRQARTGSNRTPGWQSRIAGRVGEPAAVNFTARRATLHDTSAPVPHLRLIGVIRATTPQWKLLHHAE